MARSTINRMHDVDTSFIGGAAPYTDTLTATGQVGNDYDLDKLVSGRGSLKDRLAAQGYDVVIAVTDIDVTSADETYAFEVTVGDGTTQTVVGSIAGVSKKGQYILSIDAATAEAVGSDWTTLQLDATIAGTTPSITVMAWVDLRRAG